MSATSHNPTARDRLARVLVLVGICSLAFNDVFPLLPAGELGNDAFLYVFPFFALYLFQVPGETAFPMYLIVLILAMFACIVLGIAMNYHDITMAYFKGRSGFSRVATQSMMLVFGLLVALMFYDLARRGFILTISRGARLAVLVMAVFGIFEVGSWYELPGLTEVHLALAGIIHGGSGAEYTERLRMTAFEVSWAAVMLSFFFPFGIIGLRTRDWRLPAFVILVLVLTILAQSRTALLVIGFQIILLLWKSLRRRMDLVFYAASVAALGMFLLLLSPAVSQKIGETVHNMVTYGSLSGSAYGGDEENISNVTRFAGIRAGYEMFKESPFWGIGLGQYGFEYTSHLQAEDYRSFEVREFVADSSPTWPPSFSVHMRMLSETGVLGYAVYLLMIVPIFLRSLRLASADDIVGRSHLAVAMTLFGWLLLGASIDSFRFFGGWIAVGVGLALADMASATGRSRRAPEAA
jgi:hypothetical protein